MSFINDLTQRRFFPIALLACLALAIALVKLQPKMEHEPSAALITSVNVAGSPYFCESSFWASKPKFAAKA
jgi:hypothetical protein